MQKIKNSLDLIKVLSFSESFYLGIERRILPLKKYLILGIRPGSGCGGF